jgi:chromosome segregation ATPase
MTDAQYDALHQIIMREAYEADLLAARNRKREFKAKTRTLKAKAREFKAVTRKLNGETCDIKAHRRTVKSNIREVKNERRAIKAEIRQTEFDFRNKRITKYEAIKKVVRLCQLLNDKKIGTYEANLT